MWKIGSGSLDYDISTFAFKICQAAMSPSESPSPGHGAALPIGLGTALVAKIGKNAQAIYHPS